MGKFLRKTKIKNAYVLMSRQRSTYSSGWEYPVWVFIEDKKRKGYGIEQDPTIFQNKEEAEKKFNEIVSELRKDFKFGIYLYAPQGQGLI
jgi:hypothetical protein